MGQTRQHHRRLHHRQRRRDHHLPGRRHHALQGRQADHLGRRHARSGGHSLAGHIKPGTVKNDIFASLDWLPTFVDIAGGPKGDELKKQIEAGQYPGIVKTTLDGVDQRDYLAGTSEKSARDTFFYYSGKHPSAVRYKNWKMYFAMVSQTTRRASSRASIPYRWTQVVNIKRDPFETSIGGATPRRLFGMGGALAGPVTAYVYDWNMLPIGQALWLKELETYIQFPPLQDPASYNLDAGHGKQKSEHDEGRATGHAGESTGRPMQASTSRGGRPKGRPRHDRHNQNSVEPRIMPTSRSIGCLRITCWHRSLFASAARSGIRVGRSRSSRSRTSSSSWATTSATGTSAPTTAA